MKTNPIGVRFRVDILEKLKKEHNAETPQKALNFLERFFVTHHILAKDLKQPLRSNVEINAPQTSNAVFDAANKEIKKTNMKSNQFETVQDNTIIWEKIKEIQLEIIPSHRNTPLGKKSWQQEQQKRIQELKNQLK